MRTVAAVRQAAAVLRHQRRQHGFADQPLHGQQEGPQRRRLLARRPHRPAPDRATLPTASAAARRSPACRSSPAASRRRCAGWPITTTGATPSAARSCSTAKPTSSSTAWARQAIVEIAQRLAAGKTVRDLRDMRGVAYALGAKESGIPQPLPRPLARSGEGVSQRLRRRLPEAEGRSSCSLPASGRGGRGVERSILLPSFEDVRADKLAFVEATRLIHVNTNPFNAATLVQFHDRQAVVATPPALPISEADMDRIYDLPYTRRPHPRTRKPIPAYEMIKDSVTIMRGCFGGCTFCSITAHQGRIIQSRSQESILKRSAQARRRPGISRASSATSAGRPPTCTRCAAPGPRSRRSASGFRACIRPSANCSAPIMARSSN